MQRRTRQLPLIPSQTSSARKSLMQSWCLLTPISKSFEILAKFQVWMLMWFIINIPPTHEKALYCFLFFLGLDLAYFKNGYVYHTKYDDIQHVSLSSVQRAGDNLLALVSNLAKSDWPSVRDSSDIIIFFDYLGLFMITFSNLSWHLLNITLISLAFYQSIAWVTIQDGKSNLNFML